MADKVHLTDALVGRLPRPATGKRITGDDEIHGFGVRITAGNARTFVLRYTTRSGRERTHKIGDAEIWRTTAARAEAKRLRQIIDQGGDPRGDIEDERAAPTVAELCDRFEQEHLPRKRASTAADYAQLLKNHIRPHFGQHTKVADVRFEDCDALHRRVTKTGATYTANRCISVLSKLFNLSIRWGMRTDNPAKGVERNTEYHRRRYLSAEELGQLVTALAKHPDQQTADAVRMLLLSGARKGEVLSMRWADVDLGKGTWSKPPASTKQKEHHQVPLSAPARALLNRIRAEQADKRHGLPAFVFPSTGASGHLVEVKKGWARLCKDANIVGLRLHDLRHSHASFLVSGGASLALVGAVLGHSNPTTSARYSHLHDDPVRAAVERVGALVENAGKPAPVVKLRKRGGAS